jgi:transcriptional regulator with XRE-family HTH domain
MFAENLKRLRAAAGLTQATFAEAAGLPLRTVQNWEQGHREPRLDMILPLARALGVTADELLADEEPGAPRQKPKATKPRRPRGG